MNAARRARKKYARTPLALDLTGAQVAGLLLHREGLSRIGVDAGAAPLAERYAPVAGRIGLAGETARPAAPCTPRRRRRSSSAQVTYSTPTATGLLLCASTGREFSVALALEPFSAALLLRFDCSVGEGRVALGLAAPLLLGASLPTPLFVASRVERRTSLRWNSSTARPLR